ncbi:MAG: hypothetical protein JWP34_4168 [Massilia sp.]|nr:hypothetical protein [Massilia sp.]
MWGEIVVERPLAQWSDVWNNPISRGFSSVYWHTLVPDNGKQL